MSNDLLSTDKALEELLTELEKLKSVSQQLDNAGQAMTGVTQSSQNIARLSRMVAENSRKQTDAITDFMTDLQPQLIRMQKSLSINRWLLILTFLLIFSDFAFNVWRFLVQ
jgi:hypothetical protein